MRVLVLAKSSSFHTERFVAELRRQGCYVLVASLERGGLLHFHLKRRGPHRLFHYIFAAPQIRALVKRFHPDIVNPHYAAAYGFAAALAKINSRVPIVLNLWGGDVLIAPNKSWLHRIKPVLALKAADCVIGDSGYIIEEAAKLTRLQSSRVIPWGIESKFLSYHKGCYEFNRPIKVIVPRRQEPLYNNEFILETLMPFLQNRAIVLTFPRFGRYADTFVNRAKHLAGDLVQFYEAMSRDKFLQFASEHDIYLSAAATDSSPASLIEAMGLGLLPVAADIAGISEWMTAETGYLFQLNDPESLRSVFNTLLRERNPHEGIRRRNLERVKQEAIFEDNIAEQIALMRRLVENRRS
ncbi:MAG: glycosyltransferase [Candidatus Zixiibacteriota bacterium]